jgi:hypothetical protein
VKVAAADLLREAVRDQHPNETFEKALGRIVRNHGGTYEDYMEIIARVRDRAKRDKKGLAAAARSLASEVE